MRSHWMRSSVSMRPGVAIGAVVAVVGVVGAGLGLAGSPAAAPAGRLVGTAPVGRVVGTAPAVRVHRSAAARSSSPVPGAANASVPGGVDVPVSGASTRDGKGLWVASTSGAVANEGDAPRLRGRSRPTAPVIGITPTPSGKGYWLLGADGSIHSYGSAGYHHSLQGQRLPQPVVAMASSPSGRGYVMAGRLGRVYAFGDAAYHGGAALDHLTEPIVAVAETPNGDGYWLAGRSGRVINFGAAGFYGSANNTRIGAPIVSMAATPSGHGYWLLDRDGRVYGYGRATVYGSAAKPAAPAVDLVRTADGRGYWILLADGELRAFGDARAAHVRKVASNGSSLVGDVVTLDPGHNGDNFEHPGYIDHLVPSGPNGMRKACDTTGTETDGGYTEAAFNFDVVTRLTADLRDRGATVVETRSNNDGVGPCVNTRAAIGNRVHSDAALSVHADGGPPGGRGFTVLEPALFPGYNNAVVPPSDRLGVTLRNAFTAVMPISDYYGSHGLQVRNDLGGLNLSTVPKVLIECGNMRNGTDASLLVTASWRQRAANALSSGLTTFLLATGA